MKQLFSIILFLLPLAVSAQTVIEGTVRNSEKDEAAEAVNVMIQETANTTILGFSTTDKNGRYRLEYKGSKDSINVFISGFNVKKQTKRLAARSQTVDFSMEPEAIALKEVKITPPKISQRGDTINYLVDGFLDQNDRTIGDALKKMPGIEVKESGQILYQNKPINKFYIEGSDLLQGRYGIATNSIEAKNVSTVQVLENHQPIKALKDRVLSEQAAINLKLKDSAKGTITANALLGAGGSPLLLAGELTGMYFTKNRQNISTYRGNNTGDQVSRDLNSFYSSDATSLMSGGLLSLMSPSSPPISRKRYLYNRSNVVTFNNLWKLNSDAQLNVNLNYHNDREDKSSYARTEYYLPGDSMLTVEERLNSRMYTNTAEAEVQYTLNKDKNYINNLFKFNGGWDSGWGNALTVDSVHQHLDNPQYGLSNTFEMVKNLEKTSLRFYSFNGYSTLPHELSVQPVLYGDLFEQTSDLRGMLQSATQTRFQSNNRASFGLTNGRWKQDYALILRADIQHLDSELQAERSGGESLQIPDSLRNDLQWNKYETQFVPSYTYTYGDLRASVNLPVNYAYLHIDNRVKEETKNHQRVYFNPSLFLTYKLSVFWDAFVNASYSNSMGGIRNEYTGYIMQNYRSLMRNEGDLFEQHNQNYSLHVQYRNPLRSSFGAVGVTYFNREANLLYGYNYQGILQERISIARPNRTEGYSASVNIGKTIDALVTTVRLGGSYSNSNSSQLSQGTIVKYTSDSYSISPSFNSKLKNWASLSYSLTYGESRNKVEDGANDFDPIRTTKQNIGLSVYPKKGLSINFAYEYSYNSALAADNRTLSFGDVGAKYKYKSWEFLLDYTNVFNTKRYVSASYSDLSTYYYAYDLRPSEVMARVRFKIK